MNQGKYIFSQLVDILPEEHFKWLVRKYEGNKYVKSFTCWNHLLVKALIFLAHQVYAHHESAVAVEAISVVFADAWLEEIFWRVAQRFDGWLISESKEMIGEL